MRLLLFLLGFVLASARAVVPGVQTWHVGPCDVDLYARRPPVLAVACPGRDMLRVFPLPPVSPWFEDDAAPAPLRAPAQLAARGNAWRSCDRPVYQVRAGVLSPCERGQSARAHSAQTGNRSQSAPAVLSP